MVRQLQLVCLGVATVIGLLTCLTLPAVADNELATSTPAAGAVLAALPPTVVLRFVEELDPATTTVTVKDPAFATVSGPVSVAGTTATVPVTAGPNGNYVVNYRVTSADGHPVTGTVSFRVGASSAPAPAAAPADGPDGSSGNWWLWLIVGAVAVLSAAAGEAALRRRRTRRVPL